MQKTILITGSTDGLGLETAKELVSQGHQVLLHGRSKAKLEQAQKVLNEISGSSVNSYLADLSNLSEVETMAKAIIEEFDKLDVLINNAGVLKTPEPITKDELDVRFVVNTIAPYMLTKKLLPLLGTSGRVINLSSAAQSPVNVEALAGRVRLLDDLNVYAQSKLAITMWSRVMASSLNNNSPVIIAINPGSLLATKMVKEGFGMPGNDIRIGADILIRAALSDEFASASASGEYFDNDTGKFTSPHTDALDQKKSEEVVSVIESIVARKRIESVNSE